MGLKLITAPTLEPVTVAEAKSALRLDGTDFDTLISSLITAGREMAEGFQNRAYLTQTWELSLDDWPKFPLKLPKPPLQSVASIKYTDYLSAETTWSASNYIVDTSEPGRIALAYNVSLPIVTLNTISAIKIQFVAGYGATAADVPENVKNAIKLFVAHRFENPDSEDVPLAFYSLLWQDRVVAI